MGLFDKIKSTVSEVTQKTGEWVSDSSSKTKSSLNETFDKLTSSINHKDITSEQLPDINLEDSEQVSTEDVNQLNGKAGKIINDLIARIKEQLNKVDIDELLSALQEYQEKTGKNLTPLIEFIKQLSETLSEVATKGVLGILILLRDTPFNTILKLAKSIVKLIPVPGIPIIIMILEMMIKVEWLLKKVLDILIKKIEKKQAIKSKKQVVVEFLNNDNTKTEWTIAILEEGTIQVFENGSQTENTKSSLRYIAEYIGFSYDKSWTTRQFGSKLIDHIHSLQEQDVKKSNNKEELHKSARVRIEVDIVEHDYVVFNCDEDMSDSYAFNGCGEGANDIRIYLNGEKIGCDDDMIDELMGNATESPYQTFDLGKKWEDFEYITKFGYWDNISTIVWEFDVEDFDINKLTFHYECFDAIFELADYNAEEHCINLLYDGKKIEVSDSGSSDGDFEECWNLDDDDDY